VSLYDWAFRKLLDLHQFTYVHSGGRTGQKWLGVTTLLLRSTGRRSGLERTNALIHAKDGGDYVLVASNGGANIAPSWYFNVRANPLVSVQVGRTRYEGRATIIARGDGEYDRLWRLINDDNSDRYVRYQHKTERPIPLVVVTPALSSPGGR